MNREIKFRCWMNDSRKMSTPFTLDDYARDQDGEYGDNYFSDYPKGNRILMQFTGFKDKNGKEVYEGDILKWNHGVDETDNGIDEVVFEEGGFTASYPLCAFIWQNDIQVIGNIYENPELLKGDYEQK